jgi:flagellar hook-length control protein FliK
METLPIMLGQTQTAEPTSVDSQPVSSEFSELLTGQEAIDANQSPPGKAPPPGVTTPVEEAEIPEPIALSQKPDFHPQVETQVFFMPGIEDNSPAEVVDDSSTETTDNVVSSITTAIAGALALQPVVCPRPDFEPMILESTPLSEQKIDPTSNTVASPTMLTIISSETGDYAVPPVTNTALPDEAALSQPAVVNEANLAQTATKLETSTLSQSVNVEPAQNPRATSSQDISSIPVATSLQSSSSEGTNKPNTWQNTERRAFDDLAILGKYEDVVQFSASRTDPKAAASNDLMTSAFVEPTVMEPIHNESTTTPIVTTTSDEAASTVLNTSVINTVADQDSTVMDNAKTSAVTNPILFAAEQEKSNASSEGLKVPEVATQVIQQDGQVASSVTKSKSDTQDPKSTLTEGETQAQALAKEAQTKTSTSSNQNDGYSANQGKTKTGNPESTSAKQSLLVEEPKTTQNETESGSASSLKGTVNTEQTPINRTESTLKSPTTRALNTSETKEVIRQIVDRAEIAAASKPKDGVTIKLEPRDLGSITLVVKSIGDQVDAQIAASDQRVKQALENNQSQLAAAMDKRGFSLNTISISDQSSSANYTQLQEQARQFGQQQSQTRQDQHMQTPQQFGSTDSRSDQTIGLEEVRNSIRKASGRSLDLWT